MIEKSIRKYHGRIGILLSIFILIQIGSGTIIALNTLLEQSPHTHKEYADVDVHDTGGNNNGSAGEADLTEAIHHHGETVVQMLRVILGVGIIMMAISGSIIFVLTSRRRKRSV